jgi:hypothetical protein
MTNQETDALVAEKVMGWQRKTVPTSNHSNADVWVDVAVEIQAYCRDWKPTENVAAAWRVAEKLEALFQCRITVEIRPHWAGLDQFWTGEKWEDKRYEATISGGNLAYDSPNCSFAVYEDSPGLAICQAALKAVTEMSLD